MSLASTPAINGQNIMRHLLQPRVLQLAGIAALSSALACYPRLSLWLNRPGPVWYLEGLIFLCCIVLWGFVFAWHEPYASRPVFVLKLDPKLFIAATVAGIIMAAVFHRWLDPSLQAKMPDDYPPDLQHWFAAMLFSLGLTQLFLFFAPFAWSLRLFKRRWVAATLTVLFGACVLAMRTRSLATPLPPLLLAALLAGRIAMGFLAVALYLRGGVILIWWWTFLFEARLLLNFTDNP
jgi:hypothetical protein